MKRKAETQESGTDTIRFYSKKANAEYADLSNFAKYPIQVDGQEWPSTEHYYQAQKYWKTGAEYERHREKIRTEQNPMKAKFLGRAKKPPMRADWDVLKDLMMLKALRAKFTQHEKMRRLLLSTGDKKLEEASPRDRYWGTGSDGTGLNRLGVLLMQVRTELRTAE